MRTADRDLTGLPGRHRCSRLVQDGYLGSRQREPDRSWALELRLGSHDADALALGGAEHPGHPRTGEPVAQRVDGGLWQGRAGVREQPDAARTRVTPGESGENGRQ